MTYDLSFEGKAAQAAVNFRAAQQAHFIKHQADEERRYTTEFSNPLVVKLRNRLCAIYGNDALPEDLRLRAYALNSATKPYVWKRNTGWPMVKTDLRPEFPEVSAHVILLSWVSLDVRAIPYEDAERRCGWLYRIDEWIARVEANYGP